MTVLSGLRWLATTGMMFGKAFALSTPANAASAEVEALSDGGQIGRQIAFGSVSWDRGRAPTPDAVVATILFPSIHCSITISFNFKTIENYINGFYVIDVSNGCIMNWGAISMHDFDTSKQHTFVNHFVSTVTGDPTVTYPRNIALLRENDVVHLTFASTTYGHIVISFEKGDDGKALFK